MSLTIVITLSVNRMMLRSQPSLLPLLGLMVWWCTAHQLTPHPKPSVMGCSNSSTAPMAQPTRMLMTGSLDAASLSATAMECVWI